MKPCKKIRLVDKNFNIIQYMNNEKNKLITKEQVENILNQFSTTKLQIKNLQYYQNAFVHESYYQSIQNDIINNNITNSTDLKFFYIPKESNERLEFLGDSALKLVIGKYLYDRFPNEREGFLTRIKIKLEKTNTLHCFAKKLNFKQYLLLSSQVENQTIINYSRGRNTPSFYEDAFEAFCGAILLDFDYYTLEKFIISIIERYVDFSELIYVNDNFKDSLQRLFQSKKIPLPCYKPVSNFNNHFIRIVLLEKTFCPLLNIDVNEFNQKSIQILKTYMKYNNEYDEYFDLLENYTIIGIGKEKKVIDAEQKCAKNCLLNLKINLNY